MRKELKEAKEDCDILKKASAYFAKHQKYKYAFIQEQTQAVGNKYSVAAYLRSLGLSKSGYYDWRARQANLGISTLDLDTLACAAHERARKSYGAKRLQAELKALGHPKSLATIKRLRKRLGLFCPIKKRRICTTDSKHDKRIADNLLDQRFEVSAPNQVWVSDITYIDTQEGWLYLAAVKDIFTKRIVGWSMQSNMQTSLVMQAMEMAIRWSKPSQGLIAHSDRGSQYASAANRALLEKHGPLASMSRRGNCYDNAPMESFWASLKKEQVHQRNYETRQQAKADIFDYIEAFYNTSRRHSKIDYCSPAAFERQYWAEKQKPIEHSQQQSQEGEQNWKGSN